MLRPVTVTLSGVYNFFLQGTLKFIHHLLLFRFIFGGGGGGVRMLSTVLAEAKTYFCSFCVFFCMFLHYVFLANRMFQ